ncbi:hypothetical protein ACOMHN_047514 [Nucella lapillus]
MWNDSTTMEEASANTTQLSLSDFPLYRVNLAVLRICPPILILIGTFGNVMTIIVMQRLASDTSVINIYFTATAVMDLLCLYTNTLDRAILFNFDYDIKIVSSAFCKIFNFAYGIVLFGSTWFLVCMTVHRAMSVVWPHRVNVLCTRRTVYLVLTGVTVFHTILSSNYLIGFDVTLNYEGTVSCFFATQEYADFVINIFSHIDFVLISILPFFLFVGANGIMVWKLLASVERAGRSLSQGSSEQMKVREKEAKSVTFTVLAVSVAFLVLTLPFSVSYILTFDTGITQTSSSLEDIAHGLLVSNVCDMLRQANNAVNFYLYILTGSRFREEFVKIMSCWKN